MVKVKICGLRDQAALDASQGAHFVGFNFCPASPRFVTPQAAESLRAPAGAARVGLFVDPSDAEINAAQHSIDAIQLHGLESAGRVRAIRARFGLPVIKAVTIKGAQDIARAVEIYAKTADWLLLDGSRGGQGRAFDWVLAKALRSPCPWMLAGGLTPDNIREAITCAHPDAVDVSSG